jgi:hypothetical protein
MAKIYRKTDVRPPKKRYGKLVWEVGNNSITILDNTEWFVLNAKKKMLEGQPQYQRGKLALKYQFSK